MHIALPIGGGSRVYAGITRGGPKYMFVGGERERHNHMGVGIAIFPERTLTGVKKTSMRVLLDDAVEGFLPDNPDRNSRRILFR